MLFRDQFRPEPEYWAEFFRQTKYVIIESRKDILDPKYAVPNRVSLAFGLVLESRDLVYGLYSAGYGLDVIHEAVGELMDDVGRFYAVAKTVPDDMDSGYRGLYYHFLTYASLAVCFDIEKERCTDLVALYDLMYEDTPDFFFETMLAFIGFEGRGITTDIMRPQIFDRLYRVYDSEPALQPGYLQEFVKKWYQSMKHEAFYQSHRSKYQGYSGYWCVEAAATAKMLNIDDSALQKNKYYPYEMAHYRDWKLQQKIEQDVNSLGNRAPQ